MRILFSEAKFNREGRQKKARSAALLQRPEEINRRKFPRQYRVNIQLVTNLLLTSKQKFRFGLSWPGQAKTELLFYVNGRFVYNLMCDPVS